MFLEILCLKDVMRLEEEEERKSATTMFMTLTEIYYIIIFVLKTGVLPTSMVKRIGLDCLPQNRIQLQTLIINFKTLRLWTISKMYLSVIPTRIIEIRMEKKFQVM